MVSISISLKHLNTVIPITVDIDPTKTLLISIWFYENGSERFIISPIINGMRPNLLTTSLSLWKHKENNISWKGWHSYYGCKVFIFLSLLQASYKTTLTLALMKLLKPEPFRLHHVNSLSHNPVFFSHNDVFHKRHFEKHV